MHFATVPVVLFSRFCAPTVTAMSRGSRITQDRLILDHPRHFSLSITELQVARAEPDFSKRSQFSGSIDAGAKRYNARRPHQHDRHVTRPSCIKSDDIKGDSPFNPGRRQHPARVGCGLTSEACTAPRRSSSPLTPWYSSLSGSRPKAFAFENGWIQP